MPAMSSSEARPLYVRYAVPISRDDWALPEEPMPESQPHDLVLDLLKAILLAWVARAGRSAQVARNLAVRWDESRPRIGVDPDLCVIEPSAPEGDELTSLCTWKPGHVAPRLAIEVVSEGTSGKDYVVAPDKYAASGTRELWIFDPRLAGPSAKGGPFRIQVWRRTQQDEFVRVYAGEGPTKSEYLGAFLVATDEGRRLRIATGQDGSGLWSTVEESERAAKESERAAKESERVAKESERAAKEEALARVAELEALLGRAARPPR